MDAKFSVSRAGEEWFSIMCLLCCQKGNVKSGAEYAKKMRKKR